MSHLCLSKRKTSFVQINCYTALEPLSSLGLYRPTKLASTSYSVSLCCFYNLFQRRMTPSRQVVSSWTSTSSSGFPGGSLGRRNKLAGLCLCVGLLGHIFGSCCARQLLRFRMMYCWVSDPFVCNLYLSHI